MKLNSRIVIQVGVATILSAHFSLYSSLAAGWAPAESIDPGGLNGVNTAALEGCPIESADGRTLFFASNRPGGHGDTANIDIWVAFRNGPNDSWSDPQNLPAPVNSAQDDFCPTPLPGGGLLFVSRRANGCAQNSADIYFTQLHPVLGWLEPEHLGCEVNSEGDEFSPSYTGAGGGMLFFSSNRGGGLHKIYVCARLPDGGFDTPTEVLELNTPGFNSVRPNVSADGREIVFDSDRPVGGFGMSDLWSATRSSVFHAWSQPVNLGANVNSTAPETRPSLSRNGQRLYFGSGVQGGSSDIYVSDRY